MVALSYQCANVRQAISASFYLFGTVLFLDLQMAGYVVADGKVSLERFLLGNLVLNFAFATNVFFVFLVLHVVQWFVYRQVNSCFEYLNRSR